MSRWAVFGDVRAHQPLPESVVQALEGFRPDDEELCIWRDEHDESLLNVTTEVEADEMEAALAIGGELAQEVIAFVDFDVHLESGRS
jgi:glycerol dehydrogenase-like iron-containing ADH family enzyme